MKKIRPIDKLDSKLSFINNDDFISDSVLTRVSLTCLVLLIGITSFGFFTNFDISDEGFHLYLHMFGVDQTASMVGMHFFTHTMGKIFNHHILGYRFMTLFFILFFASYLSYSIVKVLSLKEKLTNENQITFYSVINISSLAFFMWTPSFDYNVFSIYSAYWMGEFFTSLSLL